MADVWKQTPKEGQREKLSEYGIVSWQSLADPGGTTRGLLSLFHLFTSHQLFAFIPLSLRRGFRIRLSLLDPDCFQEGGDSHFYINCRVHNPFGDLRSCGWCWTI
jgi:hypothetical protein